MQHVVCCADEDSRTRDMLSTHGRMLGFHANNQLVCEGVETGEDDHRGADLEESSVLFGILHTALIALPCWVDTKLMRTVSFGCCRRRYALKTLRMETRHSRHLLAANPGSFSSCMVYILKGPGDLLGLTLICTIGNSLITLDSTFDFRKWIKKLGECQ